MSSHQRQALNNWDAIDDSQDDMQKRSLAAKLTQCAYVSDNLHLNLCSHKYKP